MTEYCCNCEHWEQEIGFGNGYCSVKQERRGVYSNVCDQYMSTPGEGLDVKTKYNLQRKTVVEEFLKIARGSFNEAMRTIAQLTRVSSTFYRKTKTEIRGAAEMADRHWGSEEEPTEEELKERTKAR